MLAASAWAELGPADFAALYEKFRTGAPVTEESAPAENVRFILITGLNGTLDPLYFRRMAGELRHLTGTAGELDPARKRVFVVRPPSSQGIDEGEAFLDHKIGEIIHASPPGTRFRIVGHSLGGYRLWNYLNGHPELAAKVDATVYLQTPFGGSPLAEFLYEGTAISEVVPPLEHPFAYATLWTAGQVFGQSRPSLEALVPRTALARIERIRETGDRDLQQELLGKTIVVATQMPPYHGPATWIPGPRQFMNICGKALAKLKEGANDGLVRQADQHLPGAENRSVQIRGPHHRTFTATSGEAVPLARTVWALPASP